MTLPAPMIAKLRRLVPMLGSPIDGEALAARNAIVRELAFGQRDLHDLAAAIGCGSDPAAPMTPRPAAPMSFGDLTRAVRDLDRGRLSDRERSFLQQMLALGFNRQPRPAQRAWIEGLFTRLSARAAA